MTLILFILYRRIMFPPERFPEILPFSGSTAWSIGFGFPYHGTGQRGGAGKPQIAPSLVKKNQFRGKFFRIVGAVWKNKRFDFVFHEGCFKL